MIRRREARRGVGRKWFLVAALVLAGLAVPSAAYASAGQVDRAVASPDWTTGSIAGSFTWDQCTGNNAGSNCNWLPMAVAQPSTPDYACDASLPFSGDRNLRTVWTGGTQAANGTVPFDQASVYILQGVYGQRLCLYVAWHSHYQEPVCIAQAPILGYDPSTCPIEDHIVTSELTGALFQVQQPTRPPPAVQCVVPPLLGNTVAAAGSALSSAHCTLGTIAYAYSVTIESGQVTAQSSPTGSLLASGSRVEVTISRGAAPSCRVPGITGMTLEQARTALGRAHCSMGRVEHSYSGRVKKDRVLSQSRKHGTTLKAGSREDVVLSRGKRPHR